MNDEKKVKINKDLLNYDSLQYLSIEVSRAIEGLIGGSHPSLHFGPSIEFAEHNRYSKGDDLRNVDWKAFGRTDKYYIKSHEKEVSLNCAVLLDNSGSMDYEGQNALYSKINAAKILAGGIGHILLRQGDCIGFASMSLNNPAHLSPSNHRGHLQTLLEKLSNVKADHKKAAFSKCMKKAGSTLGVRGMIVIISDLWGFEETDQKMISALAASGHDIVIIRVLSHDEIEFPFEQVSIFSGLEKEGDVYIAPTLIRNSYKEALKENNDQWKNFARHWKINFIEYVTSEAPSKALSMLSLVQKKKRASL